MLKALVLLVILVGIFFGLGAWGGLTFVNETNATCLQATKDSSLSYAQRSNICECVGPTLIDRMNDDELFDYITSGKHAGQFIDDDIGEARAVKAFTDCAVHVGIN